MLAQVTSRNINSDFEIQTPKVRPEQTSTTNPVEKCNKIIMQKRDLFLEASGCVAPDAEYSSTPKGYSRSTPGVPLTWARHTWPVVMGMGQVRARSVVREPRIRERSGYGRYPQRRCTRRPMRRPRQHTMRTIQGTSCAASFPTSRWPPCCSPRMMSHHQTPASKPRAEKRRVAQSLHGTDARPKATCAHAPPALNPKP